VRIVVLFLFVLLASCRSADMPLTWYVLAPTPAASAAAPAPVDDGPVLVIERVELAEFLRQAGLVLQTGPQQLQLSRQHLWAQGLDEALPRLLLQELQRQTPRHRILLATDHAPDPAWRLRLQVDAFHALDTGEVVCAGRFQLIEAATGNSRVREFRFTAGLQDDGHAHAVAQLAGLTQELAALVAQELMAD
jgi:uncharacterized lipoprotein YmbA